MTSGEKECSDCDADHVDAGFKADSQFYLKYKKAGVARANDVLGYS